VELTKNPDAMISALRKISGSAPVEKAPGMVREMFLHHQKADFMDMFATHPPIDKRIAALVKFAGGRDLPPAPDQADAGPWGERPAGPWGG
jgi:heat shock protein HtpX